MIAIIASLLAYTVRIQDTGRQSSLAVCRYGHGESGEKVKSRRVKCETRDTENMQYAPTKHTNNKPTNQQTIRILNLHTHDHTLNNLNLNTTQGEEAGQGH